MDARERILHHPDMSMDQKMFWLDMEAEASAANAERDRRAQYNLTVTRRVSVTTVCSRCGHTKPYKEGDEERPCSACGGENKSWGGQRSDPGPGRRSLGVLR